MKIATYLPIFSGFYETVWQLDYSYIEEFIKEERQEKKLFSEIDFNDLKIDNSQYEMDIVNLFCKFLPDFLPDYINNIKLEKIISPKAYNFANDSADVIIDANIENIKSFIYLNKGKFCEFLKKRYSSYDGFISHYENDFESWESDTKNFTDFKINGHYLGSILDFIAIMENVKEFDLYENIYEKIYILSYVENLDDIINKSDGSLFEMLTFNGIEENFADYIVTCFENNSIQENLLNENVLSILKEYKESLSKV